ncbi:MAG: SLC13 family permease, partial [Chloroflexi bacterium]|nr:SLC13 family permease [Chloroflexota bacterium]
PPNIIIATFRAEVNGDAFRMFDFTPVGLGVAVAGLAFVALIGWRLVPRREGAASRSELFEIGDYVTEVTVTEGSALAGKRLRDLGSISDAEVTVIGLVRNGLRQYNPSSFEVLLVGDLLVVEADSRDLQALVDDAGLEMGGSPKRGEEALGVVGQRSLMEAVVVAGSPIIGETARTLNLRWRHGVNLLGVARLGARIHQRMRDIHFQVGDVLLLQGATDAMGNTLSALGCLPLAGRELDIGRPRQVGLGLALFAGALLLAAFGALPIQVAFVAAAVAMLLTNLITLSEAYESIDWSIIVLLGAMIPVGQALEVSGGADLVARSALSLAGRYPPVVSLIVVLVATMFLSDLVNNAAAAVLMAPIAISVAQGLSASPDPFLMAVAIGASCAFLTPIGHQSNTLVMGPGGYRFGDYWRMGLVLEVIIVVVAVPLIVHFWPFGTI